MLKGKAQAKFGAVFRGEAGVTLIETLVALALLGFIGLAFLSGLSSGTRAAVVSNVQTTAESLARSQMEYIKHLSYQTDATQYPVDPGMTIPSGWTVLPASVQPLHGNDDGIQKVTVTVQHHNVTVFTLKGYKTS